MQRQRHVAHRMGQIKATAGACSARRLRNGGKVKRLTGAVLHAGPQHQRHFIAALCQQLLQRGGADHILALRRSDFDQAIVRC